MARLETGLNTSFNYMEESDEAYLYEENTVNSLKLKNLIDEDAYNSARFGDDHKYISSKKRRDKKRKRRLVKKYEK